MPSTQTTVSVIGAGLTGLLAAELAPAGVRVEVIDRLEQPDRIALRRTAAYREIAKTCPMARSFDQGPHRNHNVKGVLSA